MFLKSRTKPTLKRRPPTISENQCTPENSLPITINAVNRVHAAAVNCLTGLRFVRLFKIMAVVGITQAVSRVVDEG